MPYRDERKALDDRRADVARDLAAIERDAARFRATVRDADALRRELADLDERIAKSEGKRVLPILEDLRIASPCHESWDGMTGDDRVRFCGSCQKNVYNLSEMTRDEAQSLLTEREGRVCVRFYRRADGTVLTSDCPVGQKKRRRRLAVYAAGASAVAAAGMALAGLTHATGRPASREMPPKTVVVAMGDVPVMGAPPVPDMGQPIAVRPPPRMVQGGVHAMGHVAPQATERSARTRHR